MTTIKVGYQDAEGFHPEGGQIVDPNAITEFIAPSLATKANASSLAAKLDKTEAAATYVVFRNFDGSPVTGKHVEITLTADGTDISDIKVVTP